MSNTPYNSLNSNIFLVIPFSLVNREVGLRAQNMVTILSSTMSKVEGVGWEHSTSTRSPHFGDVEWKMFIWVPKMRRKVAPRPRFGVTNLPSCANRAFHIIRESGGEFWDMIGRDPSSVSKSNSFAFLWKGIELKAYYFHKPLKWWVIFPNVIGNSLVTPNRRESESGRWREWVFVCLLCLCVCTGSGRRRLGEKVRSDGRESTSDVVSPEARSCFHRP